MTNDLTVSELDRPAPAPTPAVALPAAPSRGALRTAGRALLVVVYALSAAILVPYAVWVFAIESESFSRLPVIGGIIALCALNATLYFASELRFRARFSWKKAVLLAGLFMVLGLGFAGVLSVIAFSYLCEGLARISAARGRARPAFRMRIGVAAALLLTLVAFPWLNDMYFRGTQAKLLHPDYNRRNVFYAVNRAGFRGPEIAIARSTRPRLMFLGDSSPFGWPYEYQESFPFLVESLLVNGGVNAEVINAATIGQSIGAIRTQLPYYLEYRPDVVFLMTGIHYHRADTDYQRIQREGASRETGWRPFLGVPPMLVELMVFSLGSSPLFGRRGEKQDAASRPREVASFKDHLRAVIAEIQRSGAQLYLVEYPTPGAERVVQNEIRLLAAELDVPYIPLFDAIGKELANHLHDETHPDREGHRMIAREIAPVAAQAVRTPRPSAPGASLPPPQKN